MADRVRWGILATGSIARQFAGGLKVCRTGSLVAVGSRTLESAKRFTDEFGGKPYASYAEVLADPDVDAVYIATPHHLHAEWTVAAAKAGKAVLCEKPFCMNLPEAEATLAAVNPTGVFFMEAFMYRCAPQTRKLVELLQDNAVGQVRSVLAEFSFQAPRDWSNFRAQGALGGGGLMDVGGYCISFARMVAGCEPDRMHYVAHLEKSGYDGYGSGCLGFPNGITAHIASGIHLNMKNHAVVYGDEGRIEIESPWKTWKGSQMHLFRNGKDVESFDLGCTNDELYGYEADAVAEFLEAGECPYMTKADTLGNALVMDALRDSAGVVR